MKIQVRSSVRTLTAALVAAGFGASLGAQAASFTNISAAAGIPSTNSVRGAAFGDYDKDGCVDLLLAVPSGPELLKNTCAGSFTDVGAAAGISTGGEQGWGTVWADYDGDGDLDGFVASSSGANGLYRNNGNGTFTNVAATAGVDGAEQGSAGAAWADYDGDGDLDLFVAGRFGDPGVALFDKLYQNNGNGTFTDVAAAAGVQGPNNRLSFQGLWFDYDIDGDLDLYVTVDFGTDVLYANNGNGTFTDVSVAAGIGYPQHGMGVAVGDINGDGCLDILSSNNTQGDPSDTEHAHSALMLNNCNGTFTNANVAAGFLDRAVVEWGLNFVDFDNDTDMDVSIVAGGMLSDGEPNVLYENIGEKLVDVTDASGAQDNGAAFSSIWADIDNDGDLDWFVGNVTGGNSALLRNDGPVGNHLKIQLSSETNNTYGVGARIDVRSGLRNQARVITAGNSYASSDEPAAYFGLGVLDKADKVTVYWPNGEMTELTDVAANQTLVIAQEVAVVNGSISGVVFNPSGTPEPGVQVRARRQDTGEVFVTVTAADGSYSFPSLVPAVYRMTANKTGFSINPLTNVTLDSGEAETTNLTLRP